MVIYKRTPTSIAHAIYDLHVFAVNFSGIESATVVVVTNITII